MTNVSSAIVDILLWGFVATVAMTSLTFACQNFGLSRLSLPFLLGTWFTGDRRAAQVLGFILYMLAGWIFAFLYYLLLASVGGATWWRGLVVGFVHGLFLLTVFLPLMPYMHPRIASSYEGPTNRRRLEPPGFLALHYGYRTPVIVLAAQMLYGVVLGAAFR